MGDADATFVAVLISLVAAAVAVLLIVYPRAVLVVEIINSRIAEALNMRGIRTRIRRLPIWVGRVMGLILLVWAVVNLAP